MAGPPRADSWFPRRSDLGDLPLSQVFRSLWDHRSLDHRTAGPRARDRASDAAPSHRATARLSAVWSPEFDGSPDTSGRIGRDSVDSHVERHGLGRRGLRGRSHDLPTDSRTEHLAKMARDVSPGTSRLRHRSRDSTQKAHSDFAY